LISSGLALQGDGFRLRYFINFMTTKSLHICTATLLVSAVAGWASPTGPARLQGIVKDSKGQVIAGAEVHITAKDGSGLEKIVRTDSGGNYGVSKLPVTDYEVVLFVNGQIKASINNAKVLSDKPTQLDFKLTGQYATNQQKKHTHMIYVPAETGSNLSGRWVEVDDQTGPASTAGTDNVKRLSGEAARRFQTGGNSAGSGSP
jgi:hypothetical protein